MYVVEVDGKEKVIKSREEIQRWIRRGKISEYTVIKDVEHNKRDYASAFLEGSALKSAQPDMAEFDPQEELEKNNQRIEDRGYKSFSQKELEQLMDYYVRVKKYDRKGLVRFDDVLMLRKHIGRIKKYVIKDIAKQKVERRMGEIEDILKPAGRDKSRTVNKKQYVRQDTRVVLPPIQTKPRDYTKTQSTTPKQSDESSKNLENSFYFSIPIVIITTIMFPPFGIILIWINPKIGFRSKIIFTVIAYQYMTYILRAIFGVEFDE